MEKLCNFIEEYCVGAENYHDITEQIKETESENLDPKIPECSQLLYTFAYGRLTEFPRSNIEYETVTRANFLRNAYHIIKVKIHLHHSHTTGEIFGYVYDFCNWRVRENKTEFSCTAHSLF